jgi:hypothetical protein
MGSQSGLGQHTGKRKPGKKKFARIGDCCLEVPVLDHNERQAILKAIKIQIPHLKINFMRFFFQGSF